MNLFLKVMVIVCVFGITGCKEKPLVRHSLSGILKGCVKTGVEVSGGTTVFATKTTIIYDCKNEVLDK